MGFYPGNYVPTNPGSYPGQAYPSPPIAQPNRVTTPVGAETARPTHTTVPNPPATAVPNYVEPPVTTLPTGRVESPITVFSPATGQPTYTPLLTPLGVRPHFEPNTEDWYWNYGQGGEGGNDGGA